MVDRSPEFPGSESNLTVRNKMGKALRFLEWIRRRLWRIGSCLQLDRLRLVGLWKWWSYHDEKWGWRITAFRLEGRRDCSAMNKIVKGGKSEHDARVWKMVLEKNPADCRDPDSSRLYKVKIIFRWYSPLPLKFFIIKLELSNLCKYFRFI